MNTDITIYKKMIEIETKYESLVWFARNSEDQIMNIPEIREYVTEIQNLYPNECHELNECGDWSHGFNSGMLACIRYLLQMQEVDIDFANENFPSLDT